MKELKVHRCKENAFTVKVTSIDYGAFPFEGTFPDEVHYYRVDTEDELILQLNKEGVLYAPDVVSIYYGKLDVTNRYLEAVEGEESRLQNWVIRERSLKT